MITQECKANLTFENQCDSLHYKNKRINIINRCRKITGEIQCPFNSQITPSWKMTKICFNPYLHHMKKLTRIDVCMDACSVASSSLQPHGLQSARLICPWYFPGKNTGVDCHFLFQGIFLTQGLKPSPLFLLHWQANSLPLSHLGSPEWITDLNVIAKTLQYLEDSFLVKYNILKKSINHKIIDK